MSSVEDASGWGKELIALSILNLPVTLSPLFHRVINKPVENNFADRGDGCQRRANGLSNRSAISREVQGFNRKPSYRTL